MDASFEDLVTDSLQRRAIEVRIPADLAGLARRARRQHRRRQYFLRSGLTAVTAAGLAVVVPLATTTGPRQAGSSTLPAQTVAYVMGHAEHSITAGAEAGVEVVRTIYHGTGVPVAAPGESTVTAHTMMAWSHGDAQRETAYSADGRPLLDEAFVNPAPSRGRYPAGTTTGADYVTRTWWRGSAASTSAISIRPPASCVGMWALVVPLFWLGQPPSPALLRYYLRCGLLRLAGRQRVAGVDAIKIVSVSIPALRQVVWVDPATYLPVQTLVSTPADTGWSVLADYRWLPATPRNLALLSPPIPAGFRRVKVSQRPVALAIRLPW